MRADEAYRDRSPFQGAEDEPLLQRAVPLARDLPDYDVPSGRRDLLAGLTVAALALPSGMAYASLAGLSPVVGLYALLLPAIAYALLGSSRQLIVGPEGTLAALVAAAVLPRAAAGSAQAGELAALMALLAGLCFLLARLARLGWLADYLSRPVLLGYIHGVAVVLVIGQLGKLLGLSIAAADPIPQLREVVQELGSASGTTIAVAATALAVLIGARLFAPRLPAALLVVLLAIGASELLNLGDHGVALVGSVPSGLPSFGIPKPGWDDFRALLPSAVGLFLVCFADEVLTARSYAGRHHQHVDAGKELVATGAANIAAGLTQGMPVGGSGSRTAVNDAMGARSQVSAIVAAGAVLVVVLFLTGPIADLPKAVLGAAIVVAALGLVEPRAWAELWRTDRVEVGIAAITVIGVIATGVLQAILVAVALSIVDVVRRSARPHDAVLGYSDRLGRYADVALHPGARVTPGVVVYRLDDRLFFANASYVKGRIREALRGAPTPPQLLVLDAEGMTHVDAAGAAALADLADALAAEGVAIVMARVKGPVREHLDGAGVTAALGGPAAYHPTVRAATASSRPAPNA
ncbi:SulP family inorganic anion transporter [Conexibacter woesei]|uniref:SulP family inorganic anion transporter n=1 Tax=Conexibacter woesei TaxID=191495 RepID=UPI0004245DDB|nr:sulfate permease [Conexibacter woesei]